MAMRSTLTASMAPVTTITRVAIMTRRASIRLTPAVMQEFGIEVRVASGGSIGRTVRLPGEVVYNTDRIAHVSPMVAGRGPASLHVSVGDRVVAGQIMAVLMPAVNLTQHAANTWPPSPSSNWHGRIWARKTAALRQRSVRRELLPRRGKYREADIERTQAVNALFALGYSREQVTQTAAIEGRTSAFMSCAPLLSGIVTQRHITIGEVVRTGNDGRAVRRCRPVVGVGQPHRLPA